MLFGKKKLYTIKWESVLEFEGTRTFIARSKMQAIKKLLQKGDVARIISITEEKI